MVKKKRQSDPSENGDDSTESCDENVKTQSQCPHVAKAVDLTRLKKSLKAGGFEKDCSECLKSTKNEVSDPDFEEDLSLWMCLRCGSQLCGRARNKHALDHYNTPHSDCHSLTTNTTSWDIYCYNCNNEITASSSKKLHECVEYLKKQSLNNVNKSLPPIELPYENKSKIDLILPVENCMTMDKGKDKPNSLNLPRVRGLSNLGNTCFFNSVMQCLAQTPYLVQVLQEMSEPGEKFTLPGGKLKLKTDGDEIKEVELPEIVGQLAEWGTLTKTLAMTLTELQSGEGGVYTPRLLLSSLVNKLPQFGGGDQHDAHELLRHLLEAVRSEDLRRYQSIILSRLGMNSKVDPAKVDGEVKQKVKFYGQQASDTMLRPEQVFRGFLVSTLECQECFHQSDRAEYFLDLSLPVATSRPQPPALVRRKTPNEDNLFNNQEEHKPSKHQLKKERNAARKGARKNKGNSAKGEKSTEETNGPSKEDGKSSSESDADVEDNVEDMPRHDMHASATASTQADEAGGHLASNFTPYYRIQYESGYNSDKVVSTDSIHPSPDFDKEKTDNTPECADKDKTDFADSSTSAIPLDNKYKPLVSLENMSNPDSGVASPETTKHNSTETVDNVDSPVDGKELGSRSSLSSETNLDPASPRRCKLSPEEFDGRAEPERPASRRDFAGEYSNEVVSRGISVQGCRNLLENSGESSYDSHPENKSKEEVRTYLNDYYSRLKLTMCDVKKPSLPSPTESIGGGLGGGVGVGGAPAGPAPPRPPPAQAPRYLYDEDECSVHTCLAQFTALELLTGNNKVGCDNCTKRLNGEGGKTVYTNATKRFLVSSPPAILILHLKRFQLGPRCMFRKMSKHVDFPTILDLAPFCAMDKLRELPNVAAGQTRLLYSLYGVVEHSGGMHGGHYVAYVKARPPVRAGDPRWRFLPRSPNAAAGDGTVPAAAAAAGSDSESELSGYESGEAAEPARAPAGRWYYVSDSMVSEVTEEKVLRAQAYLLFYERIL